jgi:hypothetical protein
MLPHPSPFWLIGLNVSDTLGTSAEANFPLNVVIINLWPSSFCRAYCHVAVHRKNQFWGSYLCPRLHPHEDPDIAHSCQLWHRDRYPGKAHSWPLLVLADTFWQDWVQLGLRMPNLNSASSFILTCGLSELNFKSMGVFWATDHYKVPAPFFGCPEGMKALWGGNKGS